jgi:hypothetical protein
MRFEITARRSLADSAFPGRAWERVIREAREKTLQPRSMRNKKPAEENGKGGCLRQAARCGRCSTSSSNSLAISTHFKISHGVAQNKSKKFRILKIFSARAGSPFPATVYGRKIFCVKPGRGHKAGKPRNMDKRILYIATLLGAQYRGCGRLSSWLFFCWD